MSCLVDNTQRAERSKLAEEILNADGATGFNVETGTVGDLLEAGILDSAKGLRDALALAFVYAEGILKTAAWDSAPPSTPNRSFEISK